MKKRLIILTTFMAMAAIPMFLSTNPVETFAADTKLGTISVGDHPTDIMSSSGLVKAMADLMSGDCKNDYTNKDVVLTLDQDITADDFLPKTPSGGDLWHNSVTINLNGHTLKVTGARRHSLGSLVINGGGGKINFSSVAYGNPIFNFDSDGGGSEFSVKNTTFENMNAEELFKVNECSDTIKATDFPKGITSFTSDAFKEKKEKGMMVRKKI